LAEIVQDVIARVKHIARQGGIYLRCDEFPRDIQMDPKQVERAGFRSDRLKKGDSFDIDVRIENNGGLKTSQIRSLNGTPARPPGPTGNK
jgi:hypothetical protein